jgi:hypothetical protein
MPPAVVHCGFGALLVLISVPLVLRWVPMNGLTVLRLHYKMERTGQRTPSPPTSSPRAPVAPKAAGA